MKYIEWLNYWLENYVKPTSKQRTYDRYSQIVKNHLKNIGEFEIEQLNLRDLQQFVSTLILGSEKKSPLSASTVNGIITVIQNSLKNACVMGYAKEYFADKIIRPKQMQTDVKCFTLKEQKLIEKAVLEDDKKPLFGVIIALYTGLRIGELLALKWEDIDFCKGILTVERSCHYGKVNGKFQKIIDAPKTNSSKRIVPIPKQLLPLFKAEKRKSHSPFVVANGAKEIAVRVYQRRFQMLLKKLNIQYKSFHALRHTFATRAIECGMDVKTLSEILGHKSATITLNRYVHSLIEHKKDMMNRLGKLL